MIKKTGSIIHINTKTTSLVLNISITGHLVCEYYGPQVPFGENYDYLVNKTAFTHGTEIVYDEQLPNISLDGLSMEFAVSGKGDFREPSLILQSETSQVLDFIYESDEILTDYLPLDALPMPHHVDEVLKITLVDKVQKLKAELYYGVFTKADTISRHVVLSNESDQDLVIDKLMSLQLDMPNRGFELLNLYGAWGAENNINRRKVTQGIHINDSKTGNSSNRHNPFFMLLSETSGLNHGITFAFNLLYSGNHYEMVELTSYDRVRIQLGINPFMFHYRLPKNGKFETPIAIMSVSKCGQNGVSQNMHRFVNHHIIKGPWANKERPILLNNWEATYFKFNEAKLTSLMSAAKQAGIELFVLDDGWFSNRNDDTKGLGDYDVNEKKLPRGLAYLADKANAKGMKFGLWFEPEMVNINSNLYHDHPDWAIKTDGYEPSLGRHQLVLDLSNFEVQAYLIEQIGSVLDSAHIEYVKWDMNRHITDFGSSSYHSGELYHRYILGLYRVLKVLTSKYEHVLWEGCASGGNRFDLGMLCFFQQMWTSDNTDAYARYYIQAGISLGYPLSVIGAHVSATPSHQMLRNTPIETRFHVAAFGNLGYELDLRKLDDVDFKALKEQITYYKSHRALLQYGRFYQLTVPDYPGFIAWMVKSEDCSEAIIGRFNKLQSLLAGTDVLPGYGFDEMLTYKVSARIYDHRLKMFGGLINHVAPIQLNENGPLVNFIDKRKTMEQIMKATNEETYIVPGSALNHGGVRLRPQWAGTGYSKDVRVLGDFGSELFYIKQIKTSE
ncbi:MAG TPA: alpha-galactosidase [Bacilli bacterium]|nr:alpha-galactosidase [Bacilli bacterium]